MCCSGVHAHSISSCNARAHSGSCRNGCAECRRMLEAFNLSISLSIGRIWDLRNLKDSTPIAHFKWHKDAVTSVEWHPTEGSMLAVGAADSQVCNRCLCADACLCDSLPCDRNPHSSPYNAAASLRDGSASSSFRHHIRCSANCGPYYTLITVVDCCTQPEVASIDDAASFCPTIFSDRSRFGTCRWSGMRRPSSRAAQRW